MPQHPDRTTIGRFWFDDAEQRLWLQEGVSPVVVGFIDGFYAPKMGEASPPERMAILVGETEHGLRLLPEPIGETLQSEREERAA